MVVISELIIPLMVVVVVVGTSWHGHLIKID